ncbi:MAG: phosphoribosylaminoimidazolesuccinocarboxamide synthase [Vampirovibrionales bacterium]|nr:phosphoribosylaminoimidazolesuccinocarboxamide synthase [Vampirovibrionales bacterium]
MPTVMETPTAIGGTSVPFQGKSKELQAGTVANTLWVTFKNDATAFNGEKHAVFEGKGALNKAFTQQFFELLESAGIPTCWLSTGELPETAVYRTLQMIPVEVVVRNVAQGSLCKRLGLAENTILKAPLVEYFLKSDALGDPAIPPSAITELGLLPSRVCLKQLEWMALAVNTILSARFKAAGVTLVDFKLEMGLDSEGTLRLGDELSPDGCRLQDAASGQSLDKDVFRKGTGDLIETYQALAGKLAKSPWDLSTLPIQTYTGVVVVQSRANILNPQSRTLTHTLQQTFVPAASSLLEGGAIQQVDSQKRFQVSITATHHWQALALFNQLADEPLSNPVIEDAFVEDITLAKERS